MPVLTQIGTGGLKNNAVTSAKIGVDVIVADDIANNAITVAELANGAVTPVKLNGIAGNGTAGQALTTDGDGTFSFTTITSDLVDDTTPQLGGNLASNGNDIVFADNDKATFGSGSDLQIYHDGSNSYIADEGTGNLRVSASDRIQFYNAARNEFYAQFIADGKTSIYYDSQEKLATTATGIDVTGSVVADGLTLEDNNKALFGTGSDLEIFHDGSNSFINDTGTGTLNLRASSAINLQTPGGAASLASFTEGGAVTLYHSGSAKLATTSSGIDVTGGVTADGVTVNGVANFNDTVGITKTSGYAALEMGGASGAYIDMKNPSSDDYDARMQWNGSDLILTTSTTSGGDVVLQWQGNNTRLRTTSTGVTVEGDLNVTGSLGTGKVLQTVTTTGASEYSFSSGAWRDLTSFNATITPSSTSSKIFILVTMNGGASSNNFYGHGRVLRGTTPIGIGNSAGNAQLQIGFSIAMENGYSKQQTFSYSYMDSPSTTSATTYKVQVYPHNANFTWNRVGEVSSETGYGRSISTITLFEIGG